ncbi:MAG: glycoside hydrolase family 25 protein [Saprospiraceae bacterium]|nr:glycoside hydrolase family 25 protein [Saprospiraceae bacterium]
MPAKKKINAVPVPRVRASNRKRVAKPASAVTSMEKKIIFGSSVIILILMVSLHISGCFNDLKASKLNRDYINFPEFGIHLPTSYSIHGFDVSVHQGLLNWDLLEKAESGNVKLDFVFIKATEGRTKVDRYYKHNWQQAKKHGFIRGAYHYLLPNKSGKDQAKLFLKTVDLEEGDFVPVCDIEVTAGVDKEMIEQCVQDWLDTVEEAVGKKPIIYTSKKFYESYLSDSFSDYPLWIAHYYVPGLDLEDNNKWHFWQHSDKARIKGISKRLDFNVFNGSMDELNLFRI